MDVPIEIVTRYQAGEREIRVSAETFRAYSDGLIAMRSNRVVPHEEIYLWYKDAKVLRG
jgi:hypothetical protein